MAYILIGIVVIFISVSATQVSKASALLDETLEAWRRRPLRECPYVILDARYEKVRQGGQQVIR
jgi:putative transposase